MIRTVLTKILPFLVPAVLFLMWFWYARRQTSGEEEPLTWKDAPWFWLAASGLLALAAGLLLFRFMTGEPPGGTYVPPRFEGGEVVPGQVVR